MKGLTMSLDKAVQQGQKPTRRYPSTFTPMQVVVKRMVKMNDYTGSDRLLVQKHDLPFTITYLIRHYGIF